MDKNELLVYDYVVDTTHLKNVGQVNYGQWWNEDLEITKPQYGQYILFYDGQKYFRVGFDNLDFNYIERTDRTFPTYPMS